ncbi:MAG: MBL fold metallo-hydrolase [Pseudomonadota bacterium]
MLYLLFSPDAADELKREAKIAALARVGDVAVERMAEVSPDNHGSAVDFIRQPITVRKVADDVYYATGVGNTVMVRTDAGVVIFDTGLIIQSAKQLQALREQVSDQAARYVILSHSHADHVGGARLWMSEGTQLVAHEEFVEEQRYLTELDPYFHSRNRTLFPWMPAEPSKLGLLNFRGLVPDIEVDNDEPFVFTVGGTRFEAIAAPGAEGADNLVLWLPEQRILLSGDFFGPQFPQFPNIFTMRGEKVRKPMEYIESLDRLIALQPDIVVPSHLAPAVGAEQIRRDMQRIRDALQYVHDETVAGMNAGKSVHQLMQDIVLPEQLSLVQSHGKVSWAVRSIWEYYATWFHFRHSTELYAVPIDDVFEDVSKLAGKDALLQLAERYLSENQLEKSLHALDIAAAGQDSAAVAAMRASVLQRLLERAERTTKNDYEIYWLKAQLDKALSRSSLAVVSQAGNESINDVNQPQ